MEIKEIKLGTLVLVDLGEHCCKSFWVVTDAPKDICSVGPSAEFRLLGVLPPNERLTLWRRRQYLTPIAQDFSFVDILDNKRVVPALLATATQLFEERQKTKELQEKLEALFKQGLALIQPPQSA